MGTMSDVSRKACANHSQGKLNLFSMLQRQSFRMQKEHCQTLADSFFQIYDFSGFDVSDGGCGTIVERQNAEAEPAEPDRVNEKAFRLRMQGLSNQFSHP